jgi:hypothetical protein
MFEQEIEMEKHQSAAVPLLLMVGMIVVLVGVAAHFLVQSRKVLSRPEAMNVVSNVLKAQGPITISFHTGLIKEGFNEDPTDVHYRYLQKVGMITIGKSKGGNIPVNLTPQGSEMLKQIPGVKETKEDDGTEAYVVPLASKTLGGISNITMDGPERAKVQFSWRWDPNSLGQQFDAAGPALASFNSWDRVTLIDKYGVRFYHDAPTKASLLLAKTDQKWQVATE